MENDYSKELKTLSDIVIKEANNLGIESVVLSARKDCNDSCVSVMQNECNGEHTLYVARTLIDKVYEETGVEILKHIVQRLDVELMGSFIHGYKTKVEN